MKRPKWIRLPRLFRRRPMRDTFWWISGVVATLAICTGLSWYFWEDLHGDSDSLSTTVNKLSLVVGGIIAIELAVWRSIVGERQVETAQRSLLNERFQKGAEMLGSEDLSVRLGGIYALKHLAAEHPDQYHIQVMELLCAFVRHPTRDKSGSANLNEERQSPRADVNSVAEIIRNRDNSHLFLERNAGFKLDLSDADLRRISLTNADLSGAYLLGADLSGASLMMANLTNAQLAGAIFSKMRPSIKNTSSKDYIAAATSFAIIEKANISGAEFSRNGFHPTQGLMQKYLDDTCTDPDNRPKFIGVDDAETGKPLTWHEKSCEDE